MLLEALIFGALGLGAIGGAAKYVTDEDFRNDVNNGLMKMGDSMERTGQQRINRQSSSLERAHNSGRISDEQYEERNAQLAQQQQNIDDYRRAKEKWEERQQQKEERKNRNG